MLEAKSVSITSPLRVLLHPFTHTFQKGLITAIIGPNGAGKSILLKSLCNLSQGFEGDVLYKKNSILDWSRLKISQHIALVKQEGIVPFYFSVKEMILMGTYVLEHKIKESVIHETLRSVGLEGFAERPFKHLSQGEKCRVLIARALIMQTAVILLDEPMANLDIVQKENIWMLLRNLRQKGKTIIIVAHDLLGVKKHCDTVIFLKNGRVKYNGKAAFFFANRFMERYFL